MLHEIWQIDPHEQKLWIDFDIFVCG